jgi:predicted DNA binding CopG/RHH family protein
MRKKLPVLTTDAEAEAFVDTADLSEYDLSEMVPMRFELKRKDKSVNLRLPEKLLEAVRKRAELAGIPALGVVKAPQKHLDHSQGLGCRLDG